MTQSDWEILMVLVCVIPSLGAWSSRSALGPCVPVPLVGLVLESNEKTFCEIVEGPWWSWMSSNGW